MGDLPQPLGVELESVYHHLPQLPAPNVTGGAAMPPELTPEMSIQEVEALISSNADHGRSLEGRRRLNYWQTTGEDNFYWAITDPATRVKMLTAADPLVGGGLINR